MKRAEPLLEARDIVVRFAAGTGVVGRQDKGVKAVNGVSLHVNPGETLGLVGESGSGKSTLARALLQIGELTSGSVCFAGEVIDGKSAESGMRLRRGTAMIFQDPYGALNPRMSVGAAIAEVLRVHRLVAPGDVDSRVGHLLRTVGLDPALAPRRPAELSGGQCQRVGIARALAMEPRLLVADECVAALDVSIQGQIINLLMDLRDRIGLAMIFIAHDLSIVRRQCDRVAVMYLGRIVEEGPTEDVFGNPQHPYTASLIAAIPTIEPEGGMLDHVLEGDLPSPLSPPPGCAFHPRCPLAADECRREPAPELGGGSHRCACLLQQDALHRDTPWTPISGVAAM